LATTMTWLQVAAVSGGPRMYSVVHVCTAASRALRTFGSELYSNRKRVIARFAELLNPRALAIWFLDDGYTRIRPGWNPRAEIATCSFDTGELELLARALQDMGLHPTILRGRIHFNTTATKELSTLIAPFVPPCMRYKLHPEVADEVPFQADLYEPGPQVVMWDEAEIEEVGATGTDRTYFCIDVEETHNFVTSGGVVHNCRPPGNRDPEPEEMAACRPFLDQQLALIKPRVILTLGRFAAQAILETSSGITKLRGRTYPFGDTGATVVPTFHPAAALRGGGEVLASMRADFVRAARVLAQASR
jgi:uracil-DNA glycosylase family 4